MLCFGPQLELRNQSKLINASGPVIDDCCWQCPLCNTSLSLTSNCWVCLANHSFDVAKEGYVNLLPAQNKNSRAPGDNKEMIKARRAFLNQGFFSPLAEIVTNTISDAVANLPFDSLIRVLDCGCGEGYYTSRLKKHGPQNVSIYGLDISKPAVLLASKSYKDIQFTVASAFSIPLPDESLHIALQIFSPSADTHLHQKLRKNGALIRVTPGEKHLKELRDSIYESTNEHIIRPPDEALFTLKERQNCAFTIKLKSQSDIENLLKMTPHFWKASIDRKKTLLALNSMQLSADFIVSSYIKNS